VEGAQSHGVKFDRIRRVSIFRKDPECSRHPVGGDIRRLLPGFEPGGNPLPMKGFPGPDLQRGKGGVGFIDRKKQGGAGGEQGETGKKQWFEFPLNAEGSTASAVRESGRIQDHGVELFATPGQPGKDSADILRPKSVAWAAELISFVIFFSPLEGAGGGIDIQGFGSVGGGDCAKGAGMGEEVEQLLGSERAKPNAVIPLIGEKTQGDSGGEVDPIRQSEFPGFSSITGTEEELGCGGPLEMKKDAGGFPGVGGRRVQKRGAEGIGGRNWRDQSEGFPPALDAETVGVPREEGIASGGLDLFPYVRRKPNGGRGEGFAYGGRHG